MNANLLKTFDLLLLESEGSMSQDEQRETLRRIVWWPNMIMRASIQGELKSFAFKLLTLNNRPIDGHMEAETWLKSLNFTDDRLTLAVHGAILRNIYYIHEYLKRMERDERGLDRTYVFNRVAYIAMLATYIDANAHDSSYTART